jgi:hypothetical protein
MLGVVVCLGAVSASGQLVRVEAPRHGELGHGALLSRALGETLVSTGENDFAGASHAAIRIDHDGLWDAGRYTATVFGREAGLKHKVGVVQDGEFSSLLRSKDIGSSATVSVDGQFAWAIKNLGHPKGLWSTDASANSDGAVHAVTYALYEGDEASGFAVFFEDLPRWHSDQDFNDVAVLLTVVPTPQAAGLALAGLGGVGVLAGRRRRS